SARRGGLMINGGMILGSALAALLASEFKPRFPRQRRRYAQSLIGGALMGYGAGLASGCTIGAFFSAVPSLGLNGWVFGGGLAIGAYLGGKLIQRI
ncbi:MAG: YeeE/YedE family protein, partial [Chloroflexi bacterium]|nr:YeeE/YedE family protein [Chloroflexota bacterium]